MLHIASGDRWAGAEVQLYTLLTQLHQRNDITPRAILLNDSELANRLRARDIPVDILDESRLGALAVLRGLCALLKQHQPDIVHTHRLKENILGAVANRLTIRAASLRTVHGAEETQADGLRQLPKRLIRTLDRWVGRHLQQRVIAVSAPLAELLAIDFPREQIAIIENGVDIDAVLAAVTPVEFREREPQAVHVGLVGRLDAVKRVDIFLQMARQLIDNQPSTNWRFHIFGEGSQETSLKQLSTALSLDAHVIFHGHRRDIAACIAGLDALVMCSDHEGLPMTILEALAVGTPILAHAVGGLNVVLEGNRGGELVSQHTAEGYQRGLLQLLGRDRSQLAREGLATLHARYSAESNASAVADAYQRCLNCRADSKT